jgi:hypothetical protein
MKMLRSQIWLVWGKLVGRFPSSDPKKIMRHNHRDQCPYCHEKVRFNELRTKTFSEKRKIVKVIVQRCPECKRVVDLDIPISSRINKDE